VEMARPWSVPLRMRESGSAGSGAWTHVEGLSFRYFFLPLPH
jgi:hypothetical protein